MPLFLTRACTSRLLEVCLSRPRGAGQGTARVSRGPIAFLFGPRAWTSETLVLRVLHLEFLEFLGGPRARAAPGPPVPAQAVAAIVL